MPARPDSGRPWLPATAGALLLGSAVVPVLEFETDVPQFPEALYLPVLPAGALLAAAVLRLLVPGPRQDVERRRQQRLTAVPLCPGRVSGWTGGTSVQLPT